MIQIEHKDLSIIKSTYANFVVAEISKRINILKDLISKLNSVKKIDEKTIRGRVDLFNKAHVVLLAEPKISSAKTKEVVANLNNTQSNLAHYSLRISSIESDINYLDNPKFLYRIITNQASTMCSMHEKIFRKLTLKKSDILFEYLFSYDDYYNSAIKEIGIKLGLKVCPYCNRQYITSVTNLQKTQIVGPTYDHFFAKSDYPLLAVSFYNLIPSCYTCNSNLKLKKKFNFNTHLHPYYHSIEKSARFDFDLDVTQMIHKSTINFTPKINVTVASTTADYKRLKKTSKDTGSLDVFKIEEIYKSHSDIVEEIHEKFDRQSKHYLLSIDQLITGVLSNEEEFYRFHFGNYFDESQFTKRPLSKLTKDIYQKMKSIAIKKNGYQTKP